MEPTMGTEPRGPVDYLLIEFQGDRLTGRAAEALLDLVDQYQESYRSDPDRSYIAGSDREPPESHDVPLTAQDFDSEAHWHAVMDPWRVSDADGRVLPMWLDSRQVYAGKHRAVVHKQAGTAGTAVAQPWDADAVPSS